jgi:hypothetical protein
MFSLLTENVSGSTQEHVRAWNDARKGTRGHPSVIKQKSRQMTSIVFDYEDSYNHAAKPTQTKNVLLLFKTFLFIYHISWYM